ncbi:MAG: substrate-binding domain-containing protein [Chloroflexota bacterium]|nr:substrate-binding domain-containing protein [Chloroflexota bacterium]
MLLVSRILLVALVAAACGGASTPAPDPLAGVYTVGGGDAAITVVQALADAFVAKHPGVKFTYDTSIGSDGAVNLAAQKLFDLGMASRELTASENQIVDRVLVGVAGTGLVVHQTNTLRDLTTAQVEAIYSGKVSDWSVLGLSKQVPVIPLVREKGSSVRATFENYVYGGKPTYGGGVLEIQGGDQIRQAVGGQPGAIGMIGVTGEEPSPQGTHIVTIDGISPTKLALRDGSYKLRRPLYLVYARNTEQRPGIARFLDFVRSADGQKIIDRF